MRFRVTMTDDTTTEFEATSLADAGDTVSELVNEVDFATVPKIVELLNEAGEVIGSYNTVWSVTLTPRDGATRSTA